MTRSDQVQWEKWQVTRFAQLRPDLVPLNFSATPADPPAPDILVETGSHILGIELTQFHWDATKKGSPTRKLRKIQTQIIQDAEVDWRSRQLPPVDCWVLWNARQNFSKEATSALGEQLVAIVSKNLPGPGESVHICYPSGWRTLPAQVARIHVARPPYLDQSQWTDSEAGSVPHLRDIFVKVQSQLRAKQPKISGYRTKCQEVWLLIVDEGLGVVVEDETPPHDLSSSFDRAFFMTAYDSKVVELTLSAPSAK